MSDLHLFVIRHTVTEVKDAYVRGHEREEAVAAFLRDKDIVDITPAGSREVEFDDIISVRDVGVILEDA